MRKLLEVKNVTLKCKTRKRIDNANITVFEGDQIALIGKSGSGKTTLLQLMNGSLRPTNGRVTFNGKVVSVASKYQQRLIGTLWQDLRLIDELTVGQNINCGALGRRSTWWAIANLFRLMEYKECCKCIESVELSDNIINKNVNQLSVGQQKRVAIARLFRQQSDIILADEPLSNLDPNLYNKILNILLSNEGFILGCWNY